MKFDHPAGANPIDHLRVVGQPLPRIEGPLKVTGTAPYAYEWHEEVPGAVYAHIVGAPVGHGHVTAIDAGEALAMPGVLAVYTPANTPPLGKRSTLVVPVWAGPEIAHFGQPVALAVAETLEAAIAAAHALRITCTEAPGIYDLAAARADAPLYTMPGGAAPSDIGDFDGAFAAAPVTLDETYATPAHSHAMIEPQATVASWEGDHLTLRTSNQMVRWSVAAVCGSLGIKPDQLTLLSPYIGGGFGAKLFVHADAILAALAARDLGRPVKLAYTRPQTFNLSTHRPATIQRLRFGAERDGRITAIAHESWSGNQPGGFVEAAIQQSKLLYAGANRKMASYLADMALPEGHAMRAPGEASGMMALEVAMDELAEKLGMDPVELRLVNDTMEDPEKPGRPFSHRDLAGCLRLGAEHFGWDDRPRAPASRREGNRWIGYGVAAAFRNNIATKSGARVTIDGDGGVTVETDMTDIGTGSYTILAQTAAEMMGLEIGQVRVILGDSRLPASAGSGGQFGAHCSTSGVYAACVALRDSAAWRLGFNIADATFIGGEVRSAGRSRPLADAAGISAEDAIEYGAMGKHAQQSTFGAHFVEVAVDAHTAEVRVRRMLAVCSAGRILNPMTARSQVIGCMTMGLGAALMEEMLVETRHGLFLNHDLAGYEVPVHADIPQQEVIFLDEVDPQASPMKAKGVGELGLCGTAAAVANAVYNAVGVRVRAYPITPDRLLAGMPAFG
jgi:xanthine dehydrogenase YagR molybdenum-binding subunit